MKGEHSNPKVPRSRGTSAAARALSWRPRMSTPLFTLAVAVFIVAVDNVVFWRHLNAAAQLGRAENMPFAVAVAVFLIAALAFLLSLFSWRFLFKPIVVGVLLAASVVGYFMMTYGIVVDDTMLANTVQTDTAEAAGLFSMTLVWHLLFTGVLPAIVVWRVKLVPRPFWRALVVRGGFAVLMLLVAAGAIGLQYKDFSLVLRENRDLRMFINPTYAIYSATEYLTQTAEAGTVALRRIGEDARQTSQPASRGRRKVMILVVGETARAANWGLDGYDRETTPELVARDVINFPDAHSCGTSTSVSVPCMFSPLAREHYDGQTARHTENLVDVLQHAGVAVRWQENQAGGCKGVCDRTPTENMRIRRIDGICTDDYCRDGVFVDGLRQTIDSADGDLLIVMHTMGSHGPAYYERYPRDEAVFTPECRSNRPQDCSRAELVNSYDNTLRYTDHVLASLIDVLEAESATADTALLYLSDHGESLGENGLYLHGFPYMVAPSEQTHIPMVAWFSPGFAADSGLTHACLTAQAEKRVGQDNLFATTLGLMDVTADVYDGREDIFASCRASNAMASR